MMLLSALFGCNALVFLFCAATWRYDDVYNAALKTLWWALFQAHVLMLLWVNGYVVRW